jgi:hypothetical protein
MFSPLIVIRQLILVRIVMTSLYHTKLASAIAGALFPLVAHIVPPARNLTTRGRRATIPQKFRGLCLQDY